MKAGAWHVAVVSRGCRAISFYSCSRCTLFQIETSKHYYEFALDEEENGRRRRSTTDAEVDLRRDPKVILDGC